MKRITTLLSLLTASALVLFSGGGTGHAQAGPLKKDAPTSKVDITIYGNRLAQVQETRTVTLEEGTNRILLDGIATNYRPDSLRVLSAKASGNGGSFRFLSATYQPATLTVERILSESVGKEVEVYRDKEGIKGKLLSYAGGYMTIDTGNGEMRLVSSSDIRITGAPTGLSNTAAVVIEAEAGFKAGAVAGETASYELTFSYETTGLGWSAKHNLVYDDVASKLESWQTVVSVVNNTGTSFENATLRLLTSAAAGNDAPGGMYKLSARSGASFDAAAAPPMEATVESVGDQKTYTVPGKVQLVNGQTRQILLLEGRDVPVKREYFATVGNYSEGDNQKNVSIRLTVENCEKHNLGKPLPAGQVKVYQYNSAGIQQQTGSANLGDKAQDEIFDVVIGTASDIKFTHVLAHQTNNLDKANAAAAKNSASPSPRTGNGRVITLPTDQQDPVFEEQTWEVKVYNYKTDRDVEVKLEIYLPSPQEVAPPLTKKSATEAFTHVKAGKSSNSTLQYKTTIQVR